jgi:preprotein translocase subunit YajC
MMEFFDRYGAFFILVTIVGSFVFYSVSRDNKKEKKKDQSQNDVKDQKKSEVENPQDKKDCNK